MSDTQEFKCIFCKDNFESKEELQVHFRKHGDPNFGQSKVKNEASSSSDKKDDGEMVSCDVCSEVFPTIAKAITHKHKLHPDHDAKYFCPWCGKLFTLRHLLNKHLVTNHSKDKHDITVDSYPCHSCDVEFFIPSAMLYHNKFFHRQDTELPAIGHSRKLKKIKQDLLLIYYCPFCGEEYDNKINLHKHMIDDHFDENQNPEDVLRCPLCEAIFYHLDAYELHLTFHSIDDLYSEKNEIVSQITEFSLEAVPPLMEKVENENPDISEMLSFAMDDAADSDPDRVKKKRKKHKKSKKSAITLDEFLNMNQDVFGGNLDFQGIEEVPTQVINNSLKQKRKIPTMNPGSKISSADIAKLKQQGIVVKMKTTKNNAPNKQVPQKASGSYTTKLPGTSAITKQTDSDHTKVIAKLMNQSNSQIKIVKKPIQSTQIESSGNSLQPEALSSKFSDNENDQTLSQSKISDKQEPEKCDQNVKECVELGDNPRNEMKQDEKRTSDINNTIETLQTVNKDISIKSINRMIEDSNKLTAVKVDEGNFEMQEEKSNQSHVEDYTEEFLSTNIKSPITSEKTFLESKNLSQDLTIKPVSTNPSKLCDKTSSMSETHFSDESDEDLDKVVSSTSNKKIHDEGPQSKIVSNEPDPLKRLSTSITVRPCQKMTKISTDYNENSDEMESNISENSIEPEMKQQIPSGSNVEIEKTISKLSNVQSAKIPTRRSSEPEDDLTDKEDHKPECEKPETLTEFPRHLEALKKLGSHITFISNKPKVEISDNNETKLNQTVKAEIPSHVEALKKLGSNIILKTNKPTSIESEESEIKETVEKSLHIQALKKLGSNITFKSNKTENVSSNTTGGEGNLPKNNECSPQIVNKESKGNFSANTKLVGYNENKNKMGAPLQNISTKSVTTMNVSQELKCNMVGKIVKKTSTANEYIESEIFSVDDSDDEDLYSMSSKLAAMKNEVTKSESKNISVNKQTKKPLAGPARFKNLQKNIEDSINQTINKTNTALENSLKRLSQHITIKSNKPDALDTSTKEGGDDDWGNDSDSNDSKPGKVKISEVTEDEPGDHLQSDDNDEEVPNHKSPIVDSPDHSDNENAPDSYEEMVDIESKLKANTVKKHAAPAPANKTFNEIKNLNKDLCIRPVIRDQSPSTSTNAQDHSQTTQQNKLTKSNQSNMQINKFPNQTKVAQKSMASNKVNTVSKEVTVKTYETETVIEEITTTVTKTIRKVNQTMKQENSNVQTNNSPSISSLIGVKPATIKQRGRQVGSNNIRTNKPPANVGTPNTCNQLVPMRQIRPTNPRMPVQKNIPSTSQQGQPFTKQLKIAPNVNLRPSVKRPGPNQGVSLAKKMKESSVTSTEVSSSSDKGKCMKQFSSASHVSESSSFTSTTQTGKGTSGMSLVKTQSHSACSQQVSKISNMTGMKIMKTAQSQKTSSAMEVKTDVVGNKSTLDAIEKLQKSGLLVKKPRLEEENIESEYSDFDET